MDFVEELRWAVQPNGSSRFAVFPRHQCASRENYQPPYERSYKLICSELDPETPYPWPVYSVWPKENDPNKRKICSTGETRISFNIFAKVTNFHQLLANFNFFPPNTNATLWYALLARKKNSAKTRPYLPLSCIRKALFPRTSRIFSLVAKQLYPGWQIRKSTMKNVKKKSSDKGLTKCQKIFDKNSTSYGFYVQTPFLKGLFFAPKRENNNRF